MKEHGKSSQANAQKKDSFFYHALSRSFCRVARRIASSPRRKLSGKDFKKAESFADRDMVCRLFAAECYDLAKKFADAGQLKVSLQYAFNSLYLGFLHESRNIKYPYVMFELGLQWWLFVVVFYKH